MGTGSGSAAGAGATGAAALGVTKMVRGASCTTGTGFAIVSTAWVFGNEVLNTAAFSPGSVR